jgi:hypothetical protein
MFDDRVCPSCQVVLRDGTSICPKCGKKVDAPGTGIGLIDLPGKVYSWLVRYLGPVGAAVVAGMVVILLVAALIARAVMKG